MAANTIQFVRGDGNYHTFSMPADAWSAGGRLFFAAKPVMDDDPADSAAVINVDWGDDAVTDVDIVIDGVLTACKQYNCYFPPAATYGIESNGSDEIEYLGEFQYVPVSGVPITFPPTDPKLVCLVIFDVKRKTTP